jgi:hypothetical protein
MEIWEQIKNFHLDNPEYAIAYGGDGTLLKQISFFGMGRKFIPIRNYGCCQKHEHRLQKVLDYAKNGKLDKLAEEEGVTFHRPLKATFVENIKKEETLHYAFAEITLKTSDPTSAIRFDVLINGERYLENCISDAVIYSSEMGSHGYFKSVTRTIFRGIDNVGLGFLAPTYGINNLILSGNDKVTIVFKRDCEITATIDKEIFRVHPIIGTKIDLEQIRIPTMFIGYKEFCCYECRKNRNSTIVNDMYFC